MRFFKSQYFHWVAFFIGIWVYGQEGNYRYESYGNQSVLLGGNVTGSAEDLGLTYYNPARLSFIEEPAIVIAGKAFQLINFDLEDVFQSEIDLSDSQFNGIPGIISGTFSLKFLPNHKFAYSFISRYRSNISLDYSSFDEEGLPIGDLENVDQSFTEIIFENRLRDEWYGITWSHALKENFAIGASLFGSIYELNGRGILFINASRDNLSNANYTARTRFTQKTYGIFVKLGMAWQLEKVELGANVSLPFILIKQRASARQEEFLNGLGEEEERFVVVDLDDLEGKRRTATSVSIGAGIPIGKSKLHLSADWNSAIAEYRRIEPPDEPVDESLNPNIFNEEFRSVINFGAGADIYLSPSVRFLISFSTDYSATLASPNLFDVVNRAGQEVTLFGDFWHVGLGPDLSFKWGKITLGATYSRSSNNIPTDTDIPGFEDQDGPAAITSKIGVDRWRFIVGLEIPLVSQTVKGLPIK